MKKSSILLQHMTVAVTIMAVMLGMVFFSLSLLRDILTNPKKYFNIGLSAQDLQISAVSVSLVVISVLVSYIIYLLLTLNTRTEIKVLNATKFLNVSLDQFVKLYEGVPVPYLILNKHGEIHEENNAALRFFGATGDELKGKNIFSFRHEEDAEKAEKLLHYYKSNVPTEKEEIRLVAKNGGIKWVLLSVHEIKSPESAERMGLATIFDITEQKELDKAKTEFVTLASHQLRTPVSTVKWYMDMLLSGDLGELSQKQREYMERLTNVNENMIDLIDTLLNVSRIEIGSLKPESKPTNVEELVESVLAELAVTIREKGLVVNKKYNGKLTDIKSDPKLLRIVVQNLVSNAVKYTPNGGSITISLKDSLMERAIVVSDTGVGIPQNQQDKIFTKLFRADNVRGLVGSQGTGLGLYLVKSIMETMGGTIVFDSKEGEGSVFTIKF